MSPISPLNPKPKIAILILRSFFHNSRSLTIHNNSISSIFDRDTSVSSGFITEIYGKLLESSVVEKNLILGKLVHAQMLINGFEQDSFLATKLISLYSVCDDLPIAELVFDRFLNHNVFLLNAIVRGYAINGFFQKALDFFYQKMKEGMEPDSSSFSCILKVCSSLSDLGEGKNIHKLAAESGLDSDLFVSNSLISMYAKCGSLSDAIQVFDRMPKRDIISWNSMISGYIQNGFDQEAFFILQNLIRSGLKPDHVTVVSALTLESSSRSIGREIHGYVTRNGFESISTVCNSLISMYGKYGRVEEARHLFDNSIRCDSISWNTMISCYAQNGCFEESLELLRDMELAGFDSDRITYSGIISAFSQNEKPHEALKIFSQMLNSSLKPDAITIASILPAISDLQFLGYGKEIHAYSYRNILESDRRVRNALISVYSKCGFIKYAERVFGKIIDRDVISWSSMIMGYSQNGHFNEAIGIFTKMITTKTKPNPITITSILSSCAGVSGLRQGKEIHSQILKLGLEQQTFVGSALIDMYAKCGRIKDSRRVFDLMTEKNLVTWNAMIGGYAVHGQGENALRIFRRVEKPDQVSFIAALSACNHGGMVVEGIEVFNSMKNFNVSPREGHYACIVDILGRAGWLNQALDLIKEMPIEANSDVWGALLGACKIHSNLEIGVYTGARIIELGCRNPGFYVLLSNMFADFERWEDVAMMRKLMKERGVKKKVGCSWIEVNRGVHSFIARDRDHPKWETLSEMLRGLNEQMRGMGF